MDIDVVEPEEVKPSLSGEALPTTKQVLSHERIHTDVIPNADETEIQPPHAISKDPKSAQALEDSSASIDRGEVEDSAMQVDMQTIKQNADKATSEQSSHQTITTVNPEALMIHKPHPVLTPSPLPSLPSVYPYKFEESRDTPSSPTALKRQKLVQFAPEYTLPPLKLLSAEFNRKARPAKLQRKKEKEQQKADNKKDKDKDDWVPQGSQKWMISLKLNPVYKKLNRSSKCISTKDWSVSGSL
jgi:chromatin modification-related protein VID21